MAGRCVDEWSTSGMCRLLLAASDPDLAGLCTRTVSCSIRGRSVGCAERLTVWQAGGGVADRRIRSSPSPVRRNRQTARHSRRQRRELRTQLPPPSSAELRRLVRHRTPGLVLVIAPAGVVPATARRPSAPEQSPATCATSGSSIFGGRSGWCRTPSWGLAGTGDPYPTVPESTSWRFLLGPYVVTVETVAEGDAFVDLADGSA